MLQRLAMVSSVKDMTSAFLRIRHGQHDEGHVFMAKRQSLEVVFCACRACSPLRRYATISMHDHSRISSTEHVFSLFRSYAPVRMISILCLPETCNKVSRGHLIIVVNHGFGKRTVNIQEQISIHNFPRNDRLRGISN